MKKVILSAIVMIAMSVSFVSCRETAEKAKDATEQAGEAMDEAADEVGEAAKGAMETAGEAVDDAMETTGEAVEDDKVKAAGEDVKEAVEE